MPFSLIATSAAIVAFATILPLSNSTRWWIRDLDFPRLQIVFAGMLLTVAELYFLDLSAAASQFLLAVTIACLLYQAWWILPYMRLYPTEVKDADHADGPSRIRIMTANVLASNRNSDALIALVRQHQPDVFVTLETTQWWEQQLSSLEEDYPYTMKCPLENLYGMHLYSKLPLENNETKFLVQPDIPSMHADIALRSGQRIRAHFLHPTPPSPTENDESTERDAELLIVAKSVRDMDPPVIVAGDLNDVAWSATTRLFRKISGLLDPRIGRGMFNTFHAKIWFMRWPLDHLFHSRHFTLSYVKRLPAFGSDHFPMLVELVCDDASGCQQKGLAATEDDESEADAKISKLNSKNRASNGLL